MKIAFASDLHLEFGNVELVGDRDVDALFLAGDIVIAQRLDSFKLHFDKWSKEFKQVYWIAGNHEYYGSEFFKANEKMKEFSNQFDNVQYLNNEIVTVNGVWIFGGTLWTDCNGGNPTTEIILKQCLSDFSLIRYTTRKFLPHDCVILHGQTLKILNAHLKNIKTPGIVFTHHLPHPLSVSHRFKHEIDMNGGFVSNLDNLIADNPQIVHWVHGHSHDAADYTIHNTHVVSNPRGYYGHEILDVLFDLKYVEVKEKEGI